jgi:hypothetical protein
MGAWPAASRLGCLLFLLVHLPPHRQGFAQGARVSFSLADDDLDMYYTNASAGMALMNQSFSFSEASQNSDEEPRATSSEIWYQSCGTIPAGMTNGDDLILSSSSFLPTPAHLQQQMFRGDAFEDEVNQLGDEICSELFNPRVEEYYNTSEPGREGGRGARFDVPSKGKGKKNTQSFGLHGFGASILSLLKPLTFAFNHNMSFMTPDLEWYGDEQSKSKSMQYYFKPYSSRCDGKAREKDGNMPALKAGEYRLGKKVHTYDQ